MRWHVTGDTGARGCDLVYALQDLGDEVVSRWTKDGTSGLVDMAAQEIEDVSKSDGLVLLINAKNPHRGLATLGMAIAFNKRIVLIGPRNDPFHHLSTIEHYEKRQAFLDTREDEISV